MAKNYSKIVLFISASTFGIMKLPDEIADPDLFTQEDNLAILQKMAITIPEFKGYITRDYKGKTLEEIVETLRDKSKIKDEDETYISLSETDLSPEEQAQILRLGFTKKRIGSCPKMYERVRRRNQNSPYDIHLNRSRPLNNGSFDMLIYATTSLLPNIFEEITRKFSCKCEVYKQSLEDDLTLEFYVHNQIPQNTSCIVISPDRDMLALLSDINNCVWIQTKTYKGDGPYQPITYINKRYCINPNAFWKYLFSDGLHHLNSNIFPPLIDDTNNRLKFWNFNHESIKIIWSWLGNDYTNTLMEALKIPKLHLTFNACNDLATFMGINLSNIAQKITDTMIADYNITFIESYMNKFKMTPDFVDSKLWKFNMLFSKAKFDLLLKPVNLNKASKFSLDAMWKECEEKELWRHDKYQGLNFYIEPDGENENEKTTFKTSKGVITLHLLNSDE